MACAERHCFMSLLPPKEGARISYSPSGLSVCTLGAGRAGGRAEELRGWGRVWEGSHRARAGQMVWVTAPAAGVPSARPSGLSVQHTPQPHATHQCPALRSRCTECPPSSMSCSSVAAQRNVLRSAWGRVMGRWRGQVGGHVCGLPEGWPRDIAPRGLCTPTTRSPQSSSITPVSQGSWLTLTKSSFRPCGGLCTTSHSWVSSYDLRGCQVCEGRRAHAPPRPRTVLWMCRLSQLTVLCPFHATARAPIRTAVQRAPYTSKLPSSNSTRACDPPARSRAAGRTAQRRNAL